MEKTGTLRRWRWQGYKTLAILFLFLLISFHSHVANGLPPETPNELKTTNHNFYFGVKVGLVYVLGLELEYVIQSKNINRFYLATAVQSSLIVNSFNAGGGFFLGKTGIGLGCRYHHLLWFDTEKESKIQPGYGPEVVWNKTIGTKYIINLHAGGIITKGSFFPDISFGLFIPLNK